MVFRQRIKIRSLIPPMLLSIQLLRSLTLGVFGKLHGLTELVFISKVNLAIAWKKEKFIYIETFQVTSFHMCPLTLFTWPNDRIIEPFLILQKKMKNSDKPFEIGH